VTSTTAESEQHEYEELASLGSMPRLARRPATESFVRRLREVLGDSAAAAAIGRAVVEPAEARKRLDRLTPARVPGGTFFVLDTLVWSTAVAAYPTNNRLARARVYPAGVSPGTSEAARYRPLRPPREAAGTTATLHLVAQEPGHLIWSLERSTQFLVDNNDLSESIAAQGVMVPVTAAVTEVDFADNEPSVDLLTTPDGSSRVTGAHTVLGVTPTDVVLKFPRDDEAHRRFIEQIQAALDRPANDVSEDDVKRLHALQMPARLLLRYEPDASSSVSFPKAVEHYVHLVHVEPPTAWDEAGALDAKADSVVAQLEAHKQITPARREYLDGMLTAKEARSKGYPGEPDERALEIVALLSSDKAAVRKAVRAGLLELSPRRSSVRREERARIAVELALRPVRGLETPSSMRGARAALQNAYLNPEIWGKDLKSDGMSIEERRDAALKEVESGGPGPQCYRLAVQGAYWLAVQRVLREARFFASEAVRDSRQPQRVLDDLVQTTRGIHTLYQAVVDGRDSQPLAQVDTEGRRIKAITGGVLTMSHESLRGEVAPPATGTPPDTAATPDVPALPTRLLLTRRDEFRRALERLEDAYQQLISVQESGGRPLVEIEGIPPELADDMRARLDDLRTALALYANTWRNRNAGASAEDVEVDVTEDIESKDGSSSS
jgi:hypothetical protein